MKFLVSFLFLALILNGCADPDNKPVKRSDKDEWAEFKQNFPDVTLPYSLKTDPEFTLASYTKIDSSQALKYLKLKDAPEGLTPVYYYIGKYTDGEYTFLIYAYELLRMPKVLIAAFDKKGKKSDEIVFYSGDWMDNPAGKTISTHEITKDNETKIATRKYASDEPSEDELKSVVPEKYFFTFKEGTFNKQSEVPIEK